MITGARRILSTSAVCLATFHGGIAQATWPNDPSVNVALCTAADAQLYPTIVADGAGGAIVTWRDSHSGTNADIYAQRVNLAGEPQWTANGVALCTAANDQVYPTIVSDGAGGAIVTWDDDRSGAFDIYAQRVNAAGVPQWTADGVALCTAVNDQRVPTIAPDGVGGAIVSWQDNRNGTFFSPTDDIYAQRVNAAGVPQWTADGVALCTAAKRQWSPTILSDGAGNAIVTWMDFRSGTNWDVYAQRVSAVGVPQWAANGVALCTAANYQTYPTIVSDGAGGEIVAWHDWRNDIHSPDIYAQRVNAAGVPQWAANGVALCTDPNGQYGPTIVSDGAGGVIAAWWDLRSGPADIYAQRLNAAGVPQWNADGVALCTAANDQSGTTIVPDGAGGAIVTWEDYRSGTNYDIYAQRVNAAGVPQWAADGVALCTAANDQIGPTVASNGAGGAIVTWSDSRSGIDNNFYSYYDIYAQNIRADGTLGGSLVSAPPLSIAANFGLRSVQPNPSVGDLRVSFSLLDDTPAILELHDLTGRRIESQSVGGLGPGAHVTSLTPRLSSLPPGVYCVSITQGSHRAFSKVAIVR